jgi:hypothetical protein
VGVVPDAKGIAHGGIFSDADEAAGGTAATAVLEVLQQGEGLVVGEARGEQRGAGALGEAAVAGPAGQHTPLLIGTVAESHPEVSLAALPVVGALGVPAAEAVEVIHESVREKSVRDTCQLVIGIRGPSRKSGNVLGTPPLLPPACKNRKKLEEVRRHADLLAGRLRSYLSAHYPWGGPGRPVGGGRFGLRQIRDAGHLDKSR